MKIVLLIALLTVGECGGSPVVGYEGQNVTLSCKYDIKYHKPQSICWGRGDIPNRGCNNQLISTDGYKVEERVSSRYQLVGRLDDGDVSLTILNLTDSDAGRYGCRVHVYGLFNDEKHHIDLNIKGASSTTTSTTLDRRTSTEETTHNYTTGQLTSTETIITSSTNSEHTDKESTSVAVVLVGALFGLIALTTAVGVVIMGRRWRQLNKIPTHQHQVNSSVQFNSVQLQSRGLAEENIYQIDGGSDVAGNGGEYEYCP
ncbi:T-cell immunoglobulin and mucin domain-containing protein 4 [Larimichthys crocea]|uniref:T-cell immunoglobulin and mucin domain-containing protein 4 n=1 Tax=Larimichthys crocea TaxID=215358 RepID=UPI000622F73D|nr:T-cell immunoglobulin and mucin domain-containing protein 4 [Larimichthys crocea]